MRTEHPVASEVRQGLALDSKHVKPDTCGQEIIEGVYDRQDSSRAVNMSSTHAAYADKAGPAAAQGAVGELCRVAIVIWIPPLKHRKRQLKASSMCFF